MLAWFRRHAMILMVVLGSAAMVIFGLGSVFDSFTRSVGQRAQENPELAKWGGKSFTRSDAGEFYRRHAASQRFLRELLVQAEEKAGDRVSPMAFGISPVNNQNRSDDLPVGNIIQRVLAAEQARDKGMVVSDDMVQAYITLMSGDAGFSPRDLYRINKTVNSMSLDVVKEHLKVELLAQQMDQILSVGLGLTPNPTEGMSLYTRTAEKIECEVVQFEVASFLDKVSAKPTDAELRELYSQGKKDLRDPDNQKPGFKIPKKINVSYFSAKQNTFVQNAMNAVTDAEVQVEYDRLVASEDILVLEPVVTDNSFVIPGLEDDPAPSIPGLDEPDENEPGIDAPAPAPPQEQNDDAPAPPPADDDDPAAPPAGETNPTQTTDPPVDESTSQPVEPPAAEDSSDQVPDGSSAAVSVHKTLDQRVSITGQQESESVDPPKQQETAASDQQPETEGSAKKMTTDPGNQEVGGIGSDIETELAAQDDQPAPKFKPLAEVADSIRRKMAIPTAVRKMSEAIEEAEIELETFYGAIDDWELEGKKGDKPTIDFEKVGSDFNLSYGQTSLKTLEQMKKDPFGGLQLGAQGIIGDYLFATSQQSELFQPQRVPAFLFADEYVFWITESEDPRVPDFDECKQEIIDYWRMQQAFDLAQQDAENLKTKVNTARDQKLTEMMPDRALSTGQFSWFDSQRGGVLSQPGNVPLPSEEFMETAFSLAELEAGVAANATRETVYVIQSTSGVRPIKEVGRDYIENQLVKHRTVPQSVQGASQVYTRQTLRKMYKKRNEEFGFELVD